MNDDNITMQIIRSYYPGAKEIQKYRGDDIASFRDFGIKVNPDDACNLELSPYVMSKLRPKQCYPNAIYVASFMEYEGFNIRYAEGFVTINNEFPIEHGFIVLLKDNHRYILDPTFEIVLNKDIDDIKSEDYYVIREYTGQECNEAALKYQKYGPWIAEDKNLKRLH